MRVITKRPGQHRRLRRDPHSRRDRKLRSTGKRGRQSASRRSAHRRWPDLRHPGRAGAARSRPAGVEPRRRAGMKLAATIARSFQAGIQAELRDIERAVDSGTRDAGRGLRTELRRQVASAGLGQRLANSWQDRHYPEPEARRREPGLHPKRPRSSARSTRAPLSGAGAGASWRSQPRTRRGRAPMAGGSARAPSPSTVSGRCGSCLDQVDRRCSWWTACAPRTADKPASLEVSGVRQIGPENGARD